MNSFTSQGACSEPTTLSNRLHYTSFFNRFSFSFSFFCLISSFHFIFLLLLFLFYSAPPLAPHVRKNGTVGCTWHDLFPQQHFSAQVDTWCVDCNFFFLSTNISLFIIIIIYFILHVVFVPIWEGTFDFFYILFFIS